MGNDFNGYGIEAVKEYRNVQESGVTNMFDRNVVEAIAIYMDYTDLINIAGDSETYTDFLKGFDESYLEVEADSNAVETIRDTFGKHQ